MRWQIFRLGVSETLNGIACGGLAIALVAAADRAGTQAAIVHHGDVAAAVSGGDVSAGAETRSTEVSQPTPRQTPLDQERTDHRQLERDLQRTADTLETHTAERPPSNSIEAEPSKAVLSTQTGTTASPLAIAIPGVSTPSAKRTSAIVPPIVRQRPKQAQVTTKPEPRHKKAVASRKAGSPVKKRQQTASAR
jgi:hypothetical protein